MYMYGWCIHMVNTISRVLARLYLGKQSSNALCLPLAWTLPSERGYEWTTAADVTIDSLTGIRIRMQNLHGFRQKGATKLSAFCCV